MSKRFEAAVKHNLKLLSTLDPEEIAKEIDKIDPNFRPELDLLSHNLEWYWKKKGFIFIEGFNSDLIVVRNSFGIMWSTEEAAFNWKNKLQVALEKIDHAKDDAIIQEIIKHVEEEGKKNGVNNHDVSYYIYKYNLQKPSSITVTIMAKLVNDALKISKTKRISLPEATRQAVLDRDDYTCKSCGVKAGIFAAFATMHVDHIIPISRGGTNEMDNLQTLCPKCNGEKSDH